MRRLAGKALQAAVALTLAVAASAQSPWDDALAPLESGKLLVWVVVPPNFGPADAPARAGGLRACGREGTARGTGRRRC